MRSAKLAGPPQPAGQRGGAYPAGTLAAMKLRAAGLLDLREAVCAYVAKTRGSEASPRRVVITPWSKPVMFFAIMSTVNPGDEVLYPNPGFPTYESMINFVGAKAVPI